MPTNNVQLKRGTAAAFANVATKDPNTIYFITDTNRIYVGDSEYSRPVLYGAEAPSETMPKGTLYIREVTENLITRQQLYYSNGSTWSTVSVEPGDILGEAITAGNDGDIIPNAAATTFKVPTITVDTKGRVSNAVERTIDLVNFMPKSGGTFTGDVVFNTTLETTSNIHLYRDAQRNVPAIDWDANPGDLYIDAVSVNISSPVTMAGASTISATPTVNNSIVNKKYVDDKITEVLETAANAMVFKGTIGTNGTYTYVTSIDFQTAQIGDTYKIISDVLLDHNDSADHNQHYMKAGDLVVYTGGGTFTYVPSGDEDVTTVRIAGNGDTINVNITAQTGNVVLGDAASKTVSTSTTLNGNAANDYNLPTELAVKTYVDTADALAMPKAGGTFTGNVTADANFTLNNSLILTGINHYDEESSSEIKDSIAKINFINNGMIFENDPEVSIEAGFVPTAPFAGGSPAWNTSKMTLNAQTVEIPGTLSIEKSINGVYIESENTIDELTQYHISGDGREGLIIGIAVPSGGVIPNPTFKMGNGYSNDYDETGFLSLQSSGNYIDLDATNINLNGGVSLSQNPTENMHAVTKQYVDNLIASTTQGTYLELAKKVDITELGANNGVATLDANGKISSSQLPDGVGAPQWQTLS